MLGRCCLCVLVILSSSGVSQGAIGEFHWGSCPPLSTVRNFEFNQFKGTWYAVEQTRTISTCISYKFDEDSDGSRYIIESLRPFGFQIPSFFSNFTQKGHLDVANPTQGAKMKLSYPYSVSSFVPVNLYVVLTDYDNYAAVWTCRSVYFGNMQSVTLLSRKTTIDAGYLELMHNDLAMSGVSVDKLYNVDQTKCQYEIQINEKQATTYPPDSLNETK